GNAARSATAASSCGSRHDDEPETTLMTTTRTLREELEAAILERHCAHHPMTQKWAAGELSTTAMMGWGIEHYHWVSNVWPTFFYTMATAPNDVRRVLMENYGEENDSDRPHLPIVLRFAEANGA